MKSIKFSSTIFILIFIAACGGGDNGNTQVQNPTNPNSGNQDPDIPTPKAVSLVFPENNTECNEGTNITETTSDVNFQWNLAEDTDSYEIHIKNLDNEEESVSSSSSNNITVTILRGTPYSWHVVSKANGTNQTATSSTAKFYNAGEAVQNHAPFPATAVAPAMGKTIDHGLISLTWETSDIDEDITIHEVYFGTVSPPDAQIGETEQNQIEVNADEEKKYFWRIVTKDATGNSTASQVFEFRTK